MDKLVKANVRNHGVEVREAVKSHVSSTGHKISEAAQDAELRTAAKFIEIVTYGLDGPR